MYKIIGADGQPYGPVTADQLRRWLEERRVNAQTLVQPEGAAEWKPLSSFAEFAADLRSPPPPTIGAPLGIPPASGTDPRASNKIAAGICGILLGSLGIHKFILGYTGAGLIMLLVTILTCGLAGIVTHVIGLIEGILYLTKSDAEFVRTYVDGRKEWF
jgi:TM2 domain-containing membrane protein YozV